MPGDHGSHRANRKFSKSLCVLLPQNILQVANKAEGVKIVIITEQSKQKVKPKASTWLFLMQTSLHPCYQQIWNQPPSPAGKEGGESDQQGIAKLVLFLHL